MRKSARYNFTDIKTIPQRQDPCLAVWHCKARVCFISSFPSYKLLSVYQVTSCVLGYLLLNRLIYHLLVPHRYIFLVHHIIDGIDRLVEVDI